MDVDKLRTFLAAQSSVRLAYLFGSYAKGKVGPLSDIDVAVLLDRKLSKEERSKMRLDLIAEISLVVV